MKSLLTFALLLLLATVGLTGCYTQLGYYASIDFDRKYHRVLEEEQMAHTSKTESKESELEKHDDDADAEESEGYYGRRKSTYRNRYASPHRYDTYWTPYAPYPYYAYPPALYHPYAWLYGFHAPYRYYRSYYPYYGYYRGYYPYTNVYRRYYGYGSSRYVPLSRRTYSNRSNWRSENRRSRNSRSVTSPRTRSERPQRRIRNRNEN